MKRERKISSTFSRAPSIGRSARGISTGRSPMRSRTPRGRRDSAGSRGTRKGHRVKLEGWYEKLFEAKFVADQKELEGAEIKGVHVDEKTGAMEALDIAIKAEMKAEEFYAHQAETVDDAGAQEAPHAARRPRSTGTTSSCSRSAARSPAASTGSTWIRRSFSRIERRDRRRRS